MLAPCLSLCAAAATPAFGQVQRAHVRGTVVSEETGRPLSSVVVVLQGPSLAGLQTELTDRSGGYVITQLPPGEDYQISFYYGGGDRPCQVQPGVRLSPGKTLSIDARLGERCRKDSVQVIREAAPSVDIASSAVGAEVDQQLIRTAPVRGRTFESLLALAPGAADVAPRITNSNFFNLGGGDVGVSIAGASGLENAYVIDGLNASDPHLGVVGTELSQYFIHNLNIQVGGYMAEYGRATGGVISIVTKSGTNQTHGGVYGSWQPFQLAPPGVARLGESLVTRTRGSGSAFDVAADLGGPLLRDRIHYYVGFAATSTTTGVERQGRRLLPGPSGSPEPLSDYSCPSYLASPVLCEGSRALALRTEDLSYAQRLENVKRLYNAIVKMDFSINPDHHLTVSYLGSPSTFNGYDSALSLDTGSNQYSLDRQLHDVTGHYSGKLLSRKLQIDLFYGFHYQDEDFKPSQPDVPQITYLADASSPYSLADFEDVPSCRRYALGPTREFNPCPVTKYAVGLGLHKLQTLYRHQAIGSASYFVNLLGTHVIKLGFDFETVHQDQVTLATGRDADPSDPTSGRVVYQTDPSGDLLYIAGGFGRSGPAGEVLPIDRLASSLANRNYAVYIRDSWTVGPAPGLQLNLGVRWEAQELYGPGGQLGAGIYDNWSPRIGAVYDFTKLSSRSGRSKLFFHYGRMYESLPIYLNSYNFVPVGYTFSLPSSTCPRKSLQPGGRPLPAPGAECQFTSAVFGDYPGTTMPGLQGQYINELVLGFNYDIGHDIVIGLNYMHRNQGNVVNALSVDDGNFVALGNPGTPADPARIRDLQNELSQLERQANAPGASMSDQAAARLAERKLVTYRAQGALFSRPRRDYNALALTVSKRFSHRLSFLASYTYSRTLGNYPGTFSSYNGILSPNVDFQFVHTETLVNRAGPLPTDRPHNFKLVGAYSQPLGRFGTVMIGLNLSAYSGRPIEVLGSRPGINGLREVFILPRGSGGRLPTVSQLDLRVSSEHRLTARVTLGISVEIINLLNQRQVTNVDDEYTASFVLPIANGQPADLKRLRTLDGTPAVPNTNYGQPTAHQEPLYMRFGSRLTF